MAGVYFYKFKNEVGSNVSHEVNYGSHEMCICNKTNRFIQLSNFLVELNKSGG